MKLLFKTILWPILPAAILLSSCKQKDIPDPEPEPLPEINIQDSILTAEAEGSTFTVNYEIVNPYEDGNITASVESGSEWTSEPEVSTDSDSTGTLSFTVSANGGKEERSASISVTYSYGEGNSVNAVIKITQKCNSYDYEMAAGYFTGTYFGTRYGLNGEYNYYTWLSDMPFDEYGFGQPGGTYYRFDVYGAAPEDAANPYPADGIYTLGASGETKEMTFSPEYSTCALIGEGKVDKLTYFTDGTLTVAHKDGTYTIEATLTDTEGKTHHVCYSGEIMYEDQSEEEEGLEIIYKDIDFDATDASAVFYRQIDNDMWTTVQIYNTENCITLDLCMPFDEKGNFATGKYTISDAGTAFTCYPGVISELYGEYSIGGTYITAKDKNGSSAVACLTGGDMTVEQNGDTYSIVCNFVSADNNTMTCRYTGSLKVINIPGNNSTLTSDYVLDLTNAKGTASFIGDTFETYCDNWIIRLASEDNTGDAFTAHVACRNNGYEPGIASGEYNVSAGGAGAYLWPLEYLQGYISSDGYHGTWYTGGFTDDGNNTEQAPAISGPINITNNGDGTYSISFSLTDDKGYTWSGEWSGEITTSDDSAN